MSNEHNRNKQTVKRCPQLVLYARINVDLELLSIIIMILIIIVTVLDVCARACSVSVSVDLYLCMQQSSDRGNEIDYVVKRLIRGLASSRECARLGFSTVLTHVRLGGLIAELLIVYVTSGTV